MQWQQYWLPTQWTNRMNVLFTFGLKIGNSFFLRFGFFATGKIGKQTQNYWNPMNIFIFLIFIILSGLERTLRERERDRERETKKEGNLFLLLMLNLNSFFFSSCFGFSFGWTITVSFLFHLTFNYVEIQLKNQLFLISTPELQHLSWIRCNISDKSLHWIKIAFDLNSFVCGSWINSMLRAATNRLSEEQMCAVKNRQVSIINIGDRVKE